MRTAKIAKFALKMSIVSHFVMDSWTPNVQLHQCVQQGSSLILQAMEYLIHSALIVVPAEMGSTK
jgi:hypothetical protein